MAATTATILERTAVAAADANNVDLDVIATQLASAARRVRVLEKRRAKRAPRCRRRADGAARRRDARASTAIIRAEDAARGPGRAAAREHRVDAPPPADDPAALAVMARAPGRDPTRDGGRARARAAPHEPQPSSPSRPSSATSQAHGRAVADDAAPDEPGGWVDVGSERGWERRGCAVVSGPHGPRLEIGKSPGAPPDDVALLVGCEVEAADDGDRFAFRVAHAHQRTRVLAARNKDTRRQWSSTLSGAARNHASKAREQDMAPAAARRHGAGGDSGSRWSGGGLRMGNTCIVNSADWALPLLIFQ